MTVRFNKSLQAALLIVGALFGGATAADSTPLQKAFPTAEGYGKYAQGGRGGTVHLVTTLADSGPGSLRACVETSGPRTCIFRVSGTIVLDSWLDVRNPYLTIAGQTSPGGIQLLNSSASLTSGQGTMNIRTHDLVIRHIRFRPGVPGSAIDGVTINSPAHDIIFDHVSVSWGSDELFGSQAAPNVTVQWSLLYETLLNHSKGVLAGPGGGQTFHHNLIASSNLRNPLAGGGHSDWVNNVFYNGGEVTGEYYNERHPGLSMNHVGNIAIMGPRSRDVYSMMVYRSEPVDFHPIRIYLDGNLDWRRTDDSKPQDLLVRPEIRSYILSAPDVPLSIAASSARQGALDTLAFAGAGPFRDAADARIVNEVRTCRGQFVRDPAEVGGYPAMQSGTLPVDSDRDGMADSWETARGVTDGNADNDGDGYTNLEEYLNELAGDQITRIGTGTGTLPAFNCGKAVAATPVIPWISSYTGRTASGQTGTVLTIPRGQSVTLKWTTTNALYCKMTPGGTVAVSGTMTVTPTAPTSYYMNCSGSNNQDKSSVIVQFADQPYYPQKANSAPRPVTLTASATYVAPGDPVTLSWSATNALSCTQTGTWAKNYATAGSATVNPTTTTTYQIACVNSSGYWSASVKVETNGSSPLPSPSAPLPAIAFSAVSTDNLNWSLNWSASNASACSGSGGWSGTKPLSGSISVSPGVTTTYTLSCDGPGGSASESVTAIVGFSMPGAPYLTLVATPSKVSPERSTTLAWSSINSTGCTASGAWSGQKATAGTDLIWPRETKTYILTCTGPGGSSSEQTTVTVGKLGN